LPKPRSTATSPLSARGAVPQYISGRTSYLHVRLAFHPYPQLLPPFCNTGGCEPRRRVTVASLWPWIAHVVSGRIRATPRRAVDTRFPCGSPALALVNPQQRGCTRRIILQKARHQPGFPKEPAASDGWGVRGFRVSFIPLAGCFSPFPHGTGSLAVAEGL
jgi:hypothetical protein